MGPVGRSVPAQMVAGVVDEERLDVGSGSRPRENYSIYLFVMRPICWLHISDFHMCQTKAWSQDVVLTALCKDIKERGDKEGASVDFILATGDLAFSGRADEYAMTAGFFDAISKASGVAKQKIFCVPGNHDINRETQKMSFLGARTYIKSQHEIDQLISASDEMQTLLKRQDEYRKFQNSYFKAQKRYSTPDKPGFVSSLTIDDVRFAIVGLDSAWLAEGGKGDQGELIIGERQTIEALSKASMYKPHIMIAMAHHPLHWLREFDRRPIQKSIEDSYDFFHHGHLHEPEKRIGGRCLVLGAGASFETRQSRNAYARVTLDLLNARRKVKTIQYNPKDRRFSLESNEEDPIELKPSETCSTSELAQAMKTSHSCLSGLATYLSALLLDLKSEFLVDDCTCTFGPFSLFESQPDSELKSATIDFMAFKNILQLLYKSGTLNELVKRHGYRIEKYGWALEKKSGLISELKERLVSLEKDAQTLAGAFENTEWKEKEGILPDRDPQDMEEKRLERHRDFIRELKGPSWGKVGI